MRRVEAIAVPLYGAIKLSIAGEVVFVAMIMEYQLILYLSNRYLIL